MIEFDSETDLWFKNNTNKPTTVVQCEVCKKYYKPMLGHKCKEQKTIYEDNGWLIIVDGSTVHMCAPDKQTYDEAIKFIEKFIANLEEVSNLDKVFKQKDPPVKVPYEDK